MEFRAWLSTASESLTKPAGVLLSALLLWIAIVLQARVPDAVTSSPLAFTAVSALLIPCCLLMSLLLAAIIGHYERRRLCSRTPTRMEAADPYEAGVAFSPLAQRASREEPRSRPRYVARDVDDELRRLLTEANNRLILVVGPPAAGKTRTAFDVTRDVLPGYELLQPMLMMDLEGGSDGKGSSAIQSLLRLGSPRLSRGRFGRPFRRGHEVLWLDNLGDYLRADHVSSAELDRWLAARHSVAIATITQDDYDELSQGAAYGDEARRVIKRAEPVFLRTRLSDPERERAAKLYDLSAQDLEFLPEHFVAAKEHVRQLTEIQANGGVAEALMAAAVAWRHARLPPPIPRPFLEWAIRQRFGAIADADVTAALDRASRPVGEALALLREYEDGYDVSDFVVAHVEKQQQGKLSQTAVGLLGGYLGDQPAKLQTVVGTLLRREQEDDAEAIARQIVREPYASRAQTLIASFRTRERYPAVGMQLRRVLSGQLREPGAIDVAPTPEQQKASRELEARVPIEPWQEHVFDSTPPDPNSGRYVRFYRNLMLRRALQIAVLVLGDALAVFVGIMAVVAGKALIDGSLDWGEVGEAARIATVACTIAPLAAWWAGLYEADAERARLLLIVKALTGAAVASALCVALLDDMSLNSGATVWTSFGLAVLACWGLRHAYDSVSRSWVKKNKLVPRVLLLGPRGAVAGRGPALARASKRPMHIIGFLSATAMPGDPYCLGSYDELVTAIRRHYIQRCVILDEQMPLAERRALADYCHGENVAVEALVGTQEILLGMWSKPDVELPLLEIRPLAPSPGSRILKRTFDLAVAAVVAPVVLPLLAMVWVAVKIESPGEPARLRVRRTGRGESVFEMRRFRTRKRVGPVPADGRPIELASPGRVGRFLEHVGLDELPQYWNVLRGDMSIVGPRPFPSSMTEPEDEDFRRRFVVRPGVTGLWQLSRRGGLSERDLIEIDLIYLRFWSVFQDLAVVLRTCLVIPRRVPRSVRVGSTPPGHTGAPQPAEGD